jgi:hypothetical protein
MYGECQSTKNGKVMTNYSGCIWRHYRKTLLVTSVQNSRFKASGNGAVQFNAHKIRVYNVTYIHHNAGQKMVTKSFAIVTKLISPLRNTEHIKFGEGRPPQFGLLISPVSCLKTRLTVFENRMLKEVSGQNRNEVTTVWRRGKI